VCFTWHDRFPNGADSVINVLLGVLNLIQGKLPPILYLQLDNCSRENKNKYLIGFCHLLVHLGVFKKIKISFLPVGHTHEDCDQMFSCISRRIRHEDIITLEDLKKHVIKSYAPTPSFVHLENMASWTTFLEPFLPSRVDGITFPRVFRVQRDAEGMVRHHYKNQMQTTKKSDPYCWMPANGRGYVMLNYPKMPLEGGDYRMLTVPYKPVEHEQLAKTLELIRPRCSDAQVSWWENILARYRLEDATACTTCQGFRKDMERNGKNNKDDKDEAKAKSKLYSKAYKGLKDHLGDDEGDHGLYDGVGIPSRRDYRWEDGEYAVEEEPEEEMLSHFQTQLVGDSQDRRAEGHMRHFVGTDSSNRRGAKRSDIQIGLTTRKYLHTRTHTHDGDAIC
jgi:hypothetical protein